MKCLLATFTFGFTTNCLVFIEVSKMNYSWKQEIAKNLPTFMSSLH